MINKVLGIDEPIMNIRPDQMKPEFQHYLIAAITRGAELCSEYFPEGPGQVRDEVMQAMHLARPEKGFKILVARDVARGVWERWDQYIRENYFRITLEEPPKLEMRASTLYVYDDPSLLHRHVQHVITNQLLAQSVRWGSRVMSICNEIITRTNADDSIDRIIPDIVMKDAQNNFIHGVIQIETRHRPSWASRQRIHEIFRLAEECSFVATIGIHISEENKPPIISMVLCTKEDTGEVRCETMCLYGFGVAPTYFNLPIQASNDADHFYIDLHQVAFNTHLVLR